MKIFSKIMLVFMFLFLIVICVVEDEISSKSLFIVQNDCLRIENLTDGKENLQAMPITLAVDTLEYNWMNNESKLCYLTNHKSIQEIGVEIAKLKVYQQKNDIKEFNASLEAIKFYSKSYLHFMGASLHNVL